ncbi:copia protein [Tanacetum coccineum]
MWVYRNKKDERGIVVRNKARLVAQGYKQEEGIDYDEVFAPIAKIEAIRLFLAYASFMNFLVYQMDVKSAFLYGTIDEEGMDPGGIVLGAKTYGGALALTMVMKEITRRLTRGVLRFRDVKHVVNGTIAGESVSIDPRHGYAVSSLMDTAYWSSE